MTSSIKVPTSIASFTDFGTDGPYTGQMQAVLCHAQVPVIDLLSNAPAFDPVRSGYLLAAVSNSMPDGTLFLVVVDPGVGSDRLPLVIRDSRHWFVGPNNGVLAQVAKREAFKIQSIDWEPEHLSSSFHGRDLFSPVAVMLCQGEMIAGRELTVDGLAGVDTPDDLPEIIYIDSFGNGFTGIRASTISTDTILEVEGVGVNWARTFSDVDIGGMFWYENSIGLIEISVNKGSAEKMIGFSVGSEVSLG